MGPARASLVITRVLDSTLHTWYAAVRTSHAAAHDSQLRMLRNHNILPFWYAAVPALRMSGCIAAAAAGGEAFWPSPIHLTLPMWTSPPHSRVVRVIAHARISNQPSVFFTDFVDVMIALSVPALHTLLWDVLPT